MLKLMKSEGLTSSRLADILGTGASNISHIISGRSKPGFDLLRKILLSFPRLNPDWLLLDAEEMYRPAKDPEAVTATLGTEPTADDLFSAVSPMASSDKHAVTGRGDVETENTASDNRSMELPDIRNMTADKICRIIVVYEDRSFESFIPR